MSYKQSPVCPGNMSHPVAPRRRPKELPIETKNDPLNATYPDMSLSPNKDTKTHLNIKLNKLSIQNKNRSFDDEIDTKHGTDPNSKAGLKRSISAKTRNPKFAQSDLLHSPSSENIPVANQNAPFGLKPSHPTDSRFPYGCHGNEKNVRFQNISEESGIYSNSQNSTKSVHSNHSDVENPDSPLFENGPLTLTTGNEDRNLEETLRPNLPTKEIPIYENLPYGFNVSHSRDQSDLYLQGEVLRLRDILDTIGGVGNAEQLYKDVKSQKFRIFELELMIEKLMRDNEILKCDSHHKQQTIHSQTAHLSQLAEQNSKLLSELRQQPIRLTPSHPPPKAPPKYTPASEDTRAAMQGYYEPIRTWSDPPQREWVGNIPRKMSQSELGIPRQVQPRVPGFNTPHINQSNYPQSSSLPRSLPLHGTIQDFSNIPLNPHNNGGYPGSHDPRGAR